MKVKELITRLQTLDPELPCVVNHFEDGMLDLEQVILDTRDSPPHDVVVGLYEAAQEEARRDAFQILDESLIPPEDPDDYEFNPTTGTIQRR
jgi:hypothetical protein